MAARLFAKLTVDPALFNEQLAAWREQPAEVYPVGRPTALADDRSAVAITIDDELEDPAGVAPWRRSSWVVGRVLVPSRFVGVTAGSMRVARTASGRYSAGRGLPRWRGPDSRLDRSTGLITLSMSPRRPLCTVMLPRTPYRAGGAGGTGRAESRRGVRRALHNAGFPQIGAFGDLRAQTGNHRMALLWFQMDRGIAPEALPVLLRWQPSAARACTRATQNAWLLERRCADYGTSAARQTAGVLG